MTYVFYKRFLIIFFSIFIPLILLGTTLANIVKSPILGYIIFYSKPVLSLTLLYFGIYALVSKVKTIRKSNGPIVLIILGAFFVIMSFGPPLFSYFLIQDKKTEVMSITQLQSLKEGATDVSRKPSERLSLAQLYFLETGSAIEYLDESGKKILYSPTTSDKAKYGKHAQYGQEVVQRVSLVRSNVIALLILAIVSSFCFVVFLVYKTRNSSVI